MEQFMKIESAGYKDVSGISCETDTLRAIFLPAYGGKLVSLVCKRTGREFLAQNNANDKYAVLSYNGDYCASESSGFDDMFPTIDEIPYPWEPWKGSSTCDHGEVCGLMWHSEVKARELHMWCYGVHFPYRLDKRIWSEGGELVLSYKAENLSSFDFDYIYAAHCMIAVDQKTKVELPFQEGSPVWWVFGEEHRYLEQGYFKETDIGWTVKDCKFYFDSPPNEGICRFHYENGFTLNFRYSAKTLPHLGVWVNHGSFKGINNIAVEPGTAAIDRVDIARKLGKNSVLPAYGTNTWEIRFGIEDKKKEL